MVAYGGKPDQPSVQTCMTWTVEHTATVRAYTLLSHNLKTFFFDQSSQGVKCTSCFESSYPLLVLAFEEEFHFWLSLV